MIIINYREKNVEKHRTVNKAAGKKLNLERRNNTELL